MLKRIYADNYRSLVNFECLLSERQLILGSNGSGKSSLFDILGFVRDLCAFGRPFESPLIASRINSDTRTRWQNIPEQTFEIDVSGNGGDYQFRLVIDSGDEASGPRVAKEEVIFCGSPIFRHEEQAVWFSDDSSSGSAKFRHAGPNSALANIDFTDDFQKISWFKTWLENLLIVAPDPKAMISITSKDAIRPNLNLNNFADWFRHIKLDGGDEDYSKDLADIFDGFVRLRLEKVGRRNRELKVCFQQMDGARSSHLVEYLLDELSDGQRVLIGLYAVLHYAVVPGATVCFDEPDNFIALREVQPWLDKVLERTYDDDSGEPAQVIIASHHPQLLNWMGYKEGILFDRPDGRHTRIKRFDDPSNTGLSAAELVARGWEL